MIYHLTYAFGILFYCSLINRVDVSEPRQSFLQVAREVFADGDCNWGRIVVLFYFGFKLAVRVRR